MGRCKSLGSLKSLPFLSYASQLSGNSILCFSYPEFLRAHHRKWLQPNGCWLQGFFSFLSVLRAHIERLQSLITVTSLFTDMAGNTPFLKGVSLFFFFFFITSQLTVTSVSWGTSLPLVLFLFGSTLNTHTRITLQNQHICPNSLPGYLEPSTFL